MMWPRTVEVMLGVWLLMSPFVFRPVPDRVWVVDYACATAVIALGLVSFWTPARRAHLATLAVATGLVGHAWLTAPSAPGPPAFQNEILVGLLLAMFAVIPSEANVPPPAWRGDRCGADP